MFSAFTLSLTTMMITVYFVLAGENYSVLAVLFFINFSVILSAMHYDTIDGLKVGLDEALKNHSQANLRYLKKFHDIEPPQEGDSIYQNLDKENTKKN